MIAYPGPEMVVAPGGAGRGPVTSKSEKDGGEGGIRTHAPLAQRPLFESGTMNHSVTSPGGYFEGKSARIGVSAKAPKWGFANTLLTDALIS